VIIDAGSGGEMLSMRHAQPSGRQPTQSQTAGIQPPETSTEPTRIDSKEVEPYFANMDQLKEQVVLYPVKQEDESAGVLVRNIRRGSIFWRLGLRNRDVIKGVNGKTITSAAEADVFFQDLKKGGEITVEVMRARRPKELKIQIQ
jgi:general secretion pathway protein C